MEDEEIIPNRYGTGTKVGTGPGTADPVGMGRKSCLYTIHYVGI